MVKAGAMIRSRYTVIHWKKALLRRYLAPETQKTQGNSWKVSEARKRRTRKRVQTKRNSLNARPFDHSLRNKGESYNNNALPSTGKHHGNIRLAEKRRKISSTEDDDDCVYSLAPVSFPPSRLSPRPSQTVVATFHQRSGRRGLSVKYRGYQCTSMALAAIIVSKTMPLHNWRTPDLDAILRYGDLLHADLLHLRGRRLNDPRLALHEIPTGESNKYTVPVPDRNEKWFTRDYPIKQFLTLSKSEDYYGMVHPQNTSHQQQHKDLGYTVIEDAIDIVLQQDFDGVLITVGDVSGSVFKDSAGKIKYFDSHSNNKWGRLSIDGTAVLLTFDTIRDFVHLIRKREPRISYRYELIGLKVHVIKAQKTTANHDGNRTEQEVDVREDNRHDLPKDTLRTVQPEHSEKVEEQVYVGFEMTVRASNTSSISHNITDGSEDVRASNGNTECTDVNTDASGETGDGTSIMADCAGNIADGTEDISDLTEDITNDVEDIADEADEVEELTDNTVYGTDDIADGSQNITVGTEDDNTGTDDITDGTEPITDDMEDITDGADNIADGTDDITEGKEYINGGTEDSTEGIWDVAQNEKATTEFTENIEDNIDDATKFIKEKIGDIINIIAGIDDSADRIEAISDGDECIIAARDSDTYGIEDISNGTEDISDERSVEDQPEDLMGTEWEITAEAVAPTDMTNSTGNTDHNGQKVSNDDNDDVDINIDITEHGDITTIIGKQLSDGNEDVTDATNVDNVSVHKRNNFLEITEDGLNVIEVIDLSD